MSDLGAAMLGPALAYASAGWPVFPCKPGQKAPDTAHGFKDATTDPAVIRRWWPSSRNVAIATGAPGPDVLDVDVKPDGSGFAAFNRLKQAGMLTGARALVRTPSGGLHAYYAGTGQPSGRLVRHFLDFKAAGGYVLAPPSAVGGKPYELLDHRGGATARLDWEAVTRLLDPPGEPPRPGRHDDGDPGSLAAWVAAQQEGNRNDGLFWAACRAVEAGHGDLDGLVAAAVQAGLSEAEARRTVASAARKAAR
ncbi:MAG: bifunctional DNA primase/polymerase [Streptosporangiaceae bacterium]